MSKSYNRNEELFVYRDLRLKQSSFKLVY